MLINENFSTSNFSWIPTKVGCYLLKNQRGETIYVGKAQNIRQRIKQHFQENQNKRHFNLIKSLRTSDIQFILTNNVKEALILEQNLIKKHQPRFNILLKDDRLYPYLKITEGNNPRYLLVKKANPQKKDTYFGPFPNGTKAIQMIQVLERVFPLAKCSGNLGKPCLSYSLGQCSGHCFRQVEPIYYQKAKQKIREFFQGKIKLVEREIKKSLEKSIANLEFELAKREKKLLENIDFFISEQNVEFSRQQSYDFLGIYFQDNVLSCFFLLYRYGKLSATESQIFKIPIGLAEEKEFLQSYLYQFYQKNLPPQILHLPKMVEGVETIAEELNFICQVPQRGKKRKILEIAQQNAYQTWQNHFVDGFQRIDEIELLEKLGGFLQIPTPFFIEMLDISNLFKQDAVAGFLTCINGKVDRHRSKLYQISLLKERSDVAWIKEACFKHYQKKQDLPHLLVIDGGKAQVKSALNVLQKLNLNIPIIGLAKNDHHLTEKIVNSDFQILPLPAQESLKNFLTNLQNEVHRYVITAHRKAHRQTTLKQI